MIKISNCLNLFIVVVCGLLTHLATAQDSPIDLYKDLSIRNIGPAGMSGRVTAIDAVESNPNTIYIGAASGGVWVSNNRGTTWKPIFEHEATMSIGSILQDDRWR